MLMESQVAKLKEENAHLRDKLGHLLKEESSILRKRLSILREQLPDQTIQDIFIEAINCASEEESKRNNGKPMSMKHLDACVRATRAAMLIAAHVTGAGLTYVERK